jgi:hypothetical protein
MLHLEFEDDRGRRCSNLRDRCFWDKGAKNKRLLNKGARNEGSL